MRTHDEPIGRLLPLKVAWFHILLALGDGSRLTNLREGVLAAEAARLQPLVDAARATRGLGQT